VGYPLWWNHRSEVGGQALLSQAKKLEGLTPGAQSSPGGSSQTGTDATQTPPAACEAGDSSSASTSPVLPAILQVPSIGLEAPVLDGTSDSVLDDAVGHDPTSVWPGASGVSILLAHDASYFSHLGALKPGETISWIDDCQRLVFQVESSVVTQPGAPIPAPKGGIGLALITCSPSDALFWTPDRLVVLASLVSVGPTTQTTPTPAPPLGFAVAAPPDLAAQGLGLGQNSLLVGHLSVAGTPDAAWEEGPDPLRAAQLAFEELAAVKLTVANQDSEWWSAIALPGVTMPYGVDTSYAFDAVVTAKGETISEIQLSSSTETVDFVVDDGQLRVASVEAVS
jgi:sortase A